MASKTAAGIGSEPGAGRGCDELLEMVLERAKAEADILFLQVQALDALTQKLKERQAEILQQNGLDGNDAELMKINERLHNGRRCRSVLNRKRESYDFMISYLGNYQTGTGTEEGKKG